MVRYLGPRVKIIRRLGILPGLTNKNSILRKKSPGQHGKTFFAKNTRLSLSGDYRERLLEKQKLRYNYCITEKQLYAYYQIAKKRLGITGYNLLDILESRLDCIVFRLGIAPTIPAARQLISHKHILVNEKIVNISSFLCSIHDVITTKLTPKLKEFILENLQKKKLKRNFLEKKLEMRTFRSNKVKILIKNLLPGHLKMDESVLRGTVLSKIKRKNIDLKINELKVVEYYSR